MSLFVKDVFSELDLDDLNVIIASLSICYERTSDVFLKNSYKRVFDKIEEGVKHYEM